MKDRNISETVDFFVETMGRRGLKVDYLVKKTKLDRTTISKFLEKKWKTSPKFGTAEELAHALGYELSEVLRKDDSDADRIPPEHREMFKMYETLDPEARKIADGVIKSLYENHLNSISEK